MPPPPPSSPSREGLLARVRASDGFDLIVIGGGATGLGTALDAATRGFSTLLVEAEDFGKGTSSRATKLVHGGVRYLAQGNVSLVREALHERKRFLDNAPHLAQPLSFLVPAYGIAGRLWDLPFYGIGLAIYEALSGSERLGRVSLLGRTRALAAAPGLQPKRLAGAIRYWDGQFDDARFAVALARTAIREGAIVLNHCRVTGLVCDNGRTTGVIAEDCETGDRLDVRGRCIVNATGVWVDALRKLDEPAATDLVAPSQGVHLVVDRDHFPSSTAMLVPRTADGRVLFAVPWLGKVILGTTDTPRHDTPLEPRPFDDEIDFILAEAGRRLAAPLSRSDVRSAWAGLRPLVKPATGGRDTKRISREHTVEVSPHGLVTVTGGKWTTYRAMAESVLDTCFAQSLLPARPGGATTHLRLVGAPPRAAACVSLTEPPGPHLYGAEAALLATLPGVERMLLPGFSEAMVRFAARYELARTVEDVLARRSRWLFLDARRAADAAAAVGEILRDELGVRFDAATSVAEFTRLAEAYRVAPLP
ncbi:MAG: glycerol-3-phosphate dehydrogenase/oxidase [Planctomycetes bacterium]|nr:glycerol-3-phosphate dehydrogenase/oxidase [Planctomycetota bacterium]